MIVVGGATRRAVAGQSIGITQATGPLILLGPAVGVDDVGNQAVPDHVLAGEGGEVDVVDAVEDAGVFVGLAGPHLVGEAEKALTQMREIYAQSKLRTANYYYIYRKNQRAAINFYNETITVAPNSEAAKIAKTKIEAINRGERPARSTRKPFGQ